MQSCDFPPRRLIQTPVRRRRFGICGKGALLVPLLLLLVVFALFSGTGQSVRDVPQSERAPQVRLAVFANTRGELFPCPT